MLRRPFAVWLALLIAVFGALTHVGGAPMVDLCVASGVHQVQASSSVSPASQGAGVQQSTLLLDQCPFCRILQHQSVCLLQSLVWMPVASAVSMSPLVLQAAYVFYSIEATHLPRGPPSLVIAI